MPHEPGQQGKDKQNPEQLRKLIDEGKGADKTAAPDPAAVPLGTDSEARGHTPSEETTTAIKEEMKPVSHEAQGSERLDRSYYAEASLTKKITVFALTTVLILITLGLIYAYLPLGNPR